MIDPERDENNVKTFKTQKVMTVSQLADLLYYSVSTVRNRLRAWKAIPATTKMAVATPCQLSPDSMNMACGSIRVSFFPSTGI